MVCFSQECINIVNEEIGWKTIDANKARFNLIPISLIFISYYGLLSFRQLTIINLKLVVKQIFPVPFFGKYNVLKPS
jgi:hypothetical protein